MLNIVLKIISPVLFNFLNLFYILLMWLLENLVTYVTCIIFPLDSAIFDSPASCGFRRTDSVKLLYFPYLESKLILSYSVIGWR